MLIICTIPLLHFIIESVGSAHPTKSKGENINRDYKTNVRVSPAESGLSLDIVFFCFQVRSIDRSRFPGSPSGMLSSIKMEEVETSVRYVLGL